MDKGALSKKSIILLVVLIIITIGVITWRILPERPIPEPPIDSFKAWYVDEETGERFVRPIIEVPPLMNAAGKPTLVRMYVAECQGKEIVKFYEKFDPETQQALQESYARRAELQKQHKAHLAQEEEVVDSNAGQWIRSPEKGSKWVRGDSAEARALANLPQGCKIVWPK